MEASNEQNEAKKGVLADIQGAIDDLLSAGEKATGDVRSGIDAAIAQLREASSEATSVAQGQVEEWRQTLEQTTEDARVELGKLAVKAQSNEDALKVIEAEAKTRRKEIKDAVAYLQAVVNPTDEVSVKRVLNVPKRGGRSAQVQYQIPFAAGGSVSAYDPSRVDAILNEIM